MDTWITAVSALLGAGAGGVAGNWLANRDRRKEILREKLEEITDHVTSLESTFRVVCSLINAHLRGNISFDGFASKYLELIHKSEHAHEVNQSTVA